MRSKENCKQIYYFLSIFFTVFCLRKSFYAPCEWITKMRGRRECNCGLVNPLLATVSGMAVEESGEEEDKELEYEDVDAPGTLLALGAKEYSTSRYIEITLRFFKQCVQQASSRYMLITFKKYPPR